MRDGGVKGGFSGEEWMEVSCPAHRGAYEGVEWRDEDHGMNAR